MTSECAGAPHADTCPHDGWPLVLCIEMDGNKDRHWEVFSYECAHPARHTFRAEPDGLGGFVAVDDEGVAA